MERGHTASSRRPDLERGREFGHEAVNVGDTGSGMVALPVTLTQPGVNVLHCEAVYGGDFDSDSAGTLVQ